MTTKGWIMMILSMGFVLCLFLFCMTKVLFFSSPPPEEDADE